MHRLATWKIIALLAGLLLSLAPAAPEPAKDEVEGPNVRIIRHSDGSRTRFTRTSDNRTLTKNKNGPNGALVMRTVYRMDTHGNPIGCKIFDGKDNLLFKVSYGYRKADGLLVEERMFDARVRRNDPNTGEEMPVQRVCYVYDAQGNRSAPIVYNLLPGKTYEEVFGEKSSMYEKNPFHEEPSGTANPNAKPLKDR